MDNLISVIIPIYNVEKYVDRCIESVVNQTYKKLEIILVDDGSPDSCPQICDKWAEKDERIIVIHKQNGGVSTARNAGLDIAKGDYIGFADGDDYLEPEFYETMLNALVSNDADIVSCGMRFCKNVGEDETINYTDEEAGVIDREKAIMLIVEGCGILPVSQCNKLFKAECVGNIRFDEKYSYGEDKYFNYCVAKNINKLLMFKYVGYNYVENFSSAAHTGYNERRIDEFRIIDLIYKEVKDSPKIYECCVRGDIRKCIDTLLLMITSKSTKQYEYVRKRVLDRKEDVYGSGAYSKASKAKVFMICYIPFAFKIYAWVRHYRYAIKDRRFVRN